MKIFILFIFILFFKYISAQEGFQKVYSYEDTCFTLFQNVYVTDSNYLISGNTGNNSGNCNRLFSKIDFVGNIISIDTFHIIDEYCMIHQSQTQLDTNYRGNFITSYTNLPYFNDNSQPRIIEIDKDGNTVNKFDLDFYSFDSLSFFPNGQAVIAPNDSSYYFTFHYYDEKTTSPTFKETGVLIGKLTTDGILLWWKRISASGNVGTKLEYVSRDLSYISKNKMLLTLHAANQVAPTSSQVSKCLYICIDTLGNILSQNSFQDGQFTVAGFSILPLNDGGYLHSYYKTKLNYEVPSNPEHNYLFFIDKLDSNFQLVWKLTLDTTYFPGISFSKSPFNYLISSDSSFIFTVENYRQTGYTQHPNLGTIPLYLSPVNISNRKISDGSVIWDRDYFYWAPTDSVNEPNYHLMDLERTNDGGYITCGQVINWKMNPAPAIQFGYVLKTNCLGFIGLPEMACTDQPAGNYTVNFVNQSIQSGSYKWIFGDGDTLLTSEYVDSLSHTYPSAGNYEVTLIGYGCNGATDTLQFNTLVPELPETPVTPNDTLTYHGDGTLLTLYPNPVNSGEALMFYIGKIDSTQLHTVEIISSTGDLVFTRNTYKGDSNYSLFLELAAGTYFVRLRNDSKTLETEKLVVL